MFYSKITKKKYLIRLERGEEVNYSIKKFCKNQQIANSIILAIGSIENPILAHYNVNNKKYTEKKLPGIFELTNLTGNVGMFKNEPLVHSHATLSDADMKAYAGHLVEGKISATCEIFLIDLGSNFTKSHNEEIGLKLWDLLKNK